MRTLCWFLSLGDGGGKNSLGKLSEILVIFLVIKNRIFELSAAVRPVYALSVSMQCNPQIKRIYSCQEINEILSLRAKTNLETYTPPKINFFFRFFD